jgi:hypothetical protein
LALGADNVTRLVGAAGSADFGVVLGSEVPDDAVASVDVDVTVGTEELVDVGVTAGAAGSDEPPLLGGEGAIAVAEVFSDTVGPLKLSVLIGPIATVAVPDAVLLAGSDTVKANVELVPRLLGVGRNSRPVSCATVSVSPKVTGVMPSESSSIPFEGNAVTVTTKADEPKSVSVGAPMPIAVAALFSATVSNVELAVRGMPPPLRNWLATPVA